MTSGALYHLAVATIADVARLAGVSIATVSRVLSPGSAPHPVNPATAERVRRAAAELDFVPSALARGLASSRSGLLGFVVPDLADPHYPQVAGGAEEAARAAGLSVIVCNTLGDTSRLLEYLQLLRARRVDAVIVSGGGSLGAAELDALERSGRPVVLIGRPTTSGCVLPYVAVDNEAAGRDVARHLVLEAGRRKLVHLAGPSRQTTMLDRAKGFQAEAAHLGVPCALAETDGSPDDGARVTASLLARAGGSQPDALFAATDRLAIAALGAAHDARIAVPRDLAVMGFDDLPLAPYLRPSLSSVTQPGPKLGEAAVRLALTAASGSRVEPVLLPARIVPRGTTGR